MASQDYAAHFSVQNIPFGIASSSTHPAPQAATRIGNSVLFLHDLTRPRGLLADIPGLPTGVLYEPNLNTFAALPRPVQRAVRSAVQKEHRATGFDTFPSGSVESVADVTLHLPVEVRDFADFSCSLEHVKNAGRIIINDGNPPPAFFHFPIAYQGRASSVVVSGTPIERPVGQFRDRTAPGSPVIYAASRQMDYELEFAAIIGKPLPMRQCLNAVDADEHIFGFVVLNDWSARDIQGFEMVPLGPCNGKNVGTTISPWIVTLDALSPFTVNGQPRQQPVADSLDDPDNVTYNVQMQVDLLTDDSHNNHVSTLLGTSNVSSMYWSTRQMIAHIVSAGAALRTGDVLGTGTVSESGKGHFGCLLEVTNGGREAVILADGSSRGFLEDSDIVRMSAFAGDIDSGVGFGDCTGKIFPARLK